MNVSDFDFDLPDAQIAQAPPAERGASRLLVLDRATGVRTHAAMGDLPAFLRPGDLLVVNNTRVYPARLLGWRVPSGGAVECLLLRRLDAERWEALVHPGQKLKPGARVVFGADRPPDRLRQGSGGPLKLYAEAEGGRDDVTGGGRRVIHGEILERKFHGRRVIRLWLEHAFGPRPSTRSGPEEDDVDRAIDAIGHVPLPPYIRRPDEPDDRQRYQTVYARVRGSVAAPTAGLHFTPAILEAVEARGVDRVEITLHVGYGTFKPVRAERVEDHTVDPERYDIPETAAHAINHALDEGRRVVAVGTTTTRALEQAGQESGRVQAGGNEATVFIYPGHSFRIVQGLVTNFHVPRSSLLMLVAAFAGRERILAAYRDAIARGYRFFSYGDAMLIL